MERIEGAIVSSVQQMGLATLPSYINHYVGAGPTLIEDPAAANPDDSNSRYVIISVEKGSFRIRPGDATATIGAYAVPAGDVLDGTGTLPLEEFEIYVFSAPDNFTIVGSAGDATLTVAWI